MTPIVLVHGIFNYVGKATPKEAAARRASDCRPRLAEGLGTFSVQVPAMAMAYYADLLRRELPAQAQSVQAADHFDNLDASERVVAAEWLTAAGARMPEDPQNVGLAPLRQMLGWLVEERGGPLPAAVRERTVGRMERVLVASLREVNAYTTWPGRRGLVRERVSNVIRSEGPSVVIAHSLGSYVTYEALHACPDLQVDLLVTVGSPLGVPSLARRLEPALRAGRGAKPPGVARWVNIAGSGDLVAVPPKLGRVFPVDEDAVCDTGLGVHGFGDYLANGLLAAAIVPYLT
ncbi:hypothetical protein ACIA6E_25735 [Streptomyces sp. NPDC051815]|uniref:hypothetical protein n=1 Tax=Streptomyces sp. NPDC051815 TaxID=3365674 RepID=UPI0037AEA434